MKHFNGLTPEEAELLALLAEELGEATQAIGKILRHGFESRNPLQPLSATNREALEREIGDVEAAVGMLVDGGVLRFSRIDDARKDKLARVVRFLHHHGDSE